MKNQNNTIMIKFEEEFFRLEVPSYPEFTGETTISLYWKRGKIMKAELNKKASTDLIYIDSEDSKTVNNF